jgi:biopolymer transport protein ExbD
MRISAARQDDFEINVISLIDVMLTLLMFFVMTTTFVQHSAMKVALPESSETQQDTQRAALVVLVDSNSRYYVDNNEVLNPSLDTLKEAIGRIAGDDRERTVILRAGRDDAAPGRSHRDGRARPARLHALVDRDDAGEGSPGKMKVRR